MNDNPYAAVGFREAVQSSSKWLRRFSLAILILILILNLGSLMLLDTREWLIDFDPPILNLVAFPLFVFVVPVASFMAANGQGEADGRTTIFAWLLLIASEAFWFLMIAIGTFCRDAFLVFYWPWEARGLKIVALNNQNLSDIFWQRLLASSLPDSPLLRELPGVVLIAVYCLAASLLCWYLLKSPLTWRQTVVCAVSQMALFFPLAIGAKRFFAIKYLVSFPEIFCNL